MVAIAIALAVIASYYLFFASVRPAEKITWGVDFSQMRAESLKLDWRKTYLALLDDLGVKNIKLHTQWDWIEGQKGNFYFADVDWQLQQAKKYNAGVIYVVGMKTGRWPECHIPSWADTISQQEQQEAILEYIKEVVLRYKDDKTIIAWQAENEPMFRFGVCPWYDRDFLKKEVALIKSLDNSRPVVISDSGEQSLWWRAARIGDMVGTTLYRVSWIHISPKLGFYLHFPLSPFTYWARAQFIEWWFHKKTISVEVQAEPWTPDVSYDTLVQEQAKTMNPAQFKKNISYAKHTGFDTFYLWGVEWMYWMKELQHQPEIWNTAKELFQ